MASVLKTTRIMSLPSARGDDGVKRVSKPFHPLPPTISTPSSVRILSSIILTLFDGRRRRMKYGVRVRDEERTTERLTSTDCPPCHVDALRRRLRVHVCTTSFHESYGKSLIFFLADMTFEISGRTIHQLLVGHRFS